MGLFSAGGQVTHAMVMERTGWDALTASAALNSACKRGLIARAAGTSRKYSRYDLIDKGRAPASIENLAERAIALIVASEAGLDSEQLAEHLVSSNDEVMAALDEAADDHRVVACRLVRDGVEMRQYRKSAGARLLTPWTKPLAASAPAREIAAARARSAVLQGVDIDRAHSLPSTGRIEKLTPAAEMATTSPVAPIALDTIDEAPSPSGGGSIELAEDTQQWFCLYSSGELAMQRSDGTQVCLDSEETRALFRWLDRLGGTDLQRLAAAEEEVPA